MKYTREQACAAWLMNCDMRPDLLARILSENDDSAEKIYDRFVSSDRQYFQSLLGSWTMNRLKQTAGNAKMHDMLLTMQKKNIGILTKDSIDYPEALLTLDDPPSFLMYQGDLSCLRRHCVTIVGSRKASPQVTDVTTAMARKLAEHHVTVISGFANGIDQASHAGALEAQGATCAVLGCGIDVPYPAASDSIREEILRCGGLLLSEYGLGSAAIGWHFPVRNRLLSALGRALLVMECRIKSGTMSTVSHALSQGKQVYAYPGRIGTEWSEGTHQLLREGANYFASVSDILSDMGWEDECPQPETQEKPSLPPLTADQHLVLKVITGRDCSYDEIAASTGLDAPSLSMCLTMLQMMGLIKPLPGKCYTRA